MDFIKLNRLIPGKSVIGLIAPSGVVDKFGLEQGVKILKDWGFSVKLGRHILLKKGDYSAGSEAERIADFLEMIKDPQIAAVGCLVGGFAAAELLRFFKKEAFLSLRQQPKIFFGYSDFSLILNALFSSGIVSLHAPNICGLYRRSFTTQKSLYLSLIGELPAEIGPLADWKPLVPGFVRGRLLVSNLECLVNLLGTPLDPLKESSEDLILALEEVGEEKSTISRWLSTLAFHTETKKIGGIIIGRFTKIGEKDYPIWGKEIGIKDLFLKFFGKRKIPIASLSEFGHIEEKRSLLNLRRRERVDFLTLPSGAKVLFKVKPTSCRLRFLEKVVS